MGKTVNRDYMIMALEMAFSKTGRTSPNPPVGAVLVKDGEIISTGGTCACGCDHAEIDAIKKAQGRASGSDLYVTLEPCCHYGKTPPCTEAIIDAEIARVITPLQDPNPLVAGKGLRRLREAGVEVSMMEEMRDYAEELIGPFKRYLREGRPFVIHKSAMTLDGRTADSRGDSKWISSDFSRYLVHRLRSLVDAVIIGVNTLVRDNPTLNVRIGTFPEDIAGFFRGDAIPVIGHDSFFFHNLLNYRELCDDRSPLRVVMGVKEGIQETANFFFDDNYLFFCNRSIQQDLESSEDPFIKKLINSGKLVLVDGGVKAAAVNNALKELASRGVIYAMLEGGARTVGTFFDAGVIDQMLYFIAPKMLGSGHPLMEAAHSLRMADAHEMSRVSAAVIGNDIVYHCYNEEC